MTPAPQAYPLRRASPPNLEMHTLEVNCRRSTHLAPSSHLAIPSLLSYGHRLYTAQGVKGNFARLVSLADTPLPLPFKNIDNIRSMIYIDNLASLLIEASSNPEAAHFILVPADEEEVSIGRLLSAIRESLGRNTRLFGFPQTALEILATGTGQREVLRRLIGNFSLDASDTFARLSWRPPYSFETGIEQTISRSR